MRGKLEQNNMEQISEKVFLPNIFQAEALKKLEDTTEKGGIVIMPTGTGKTFLASLWFKRILDLDPNAKLLFVCHNRDILSQANEKEFQGCLRHLDIDFGYYTAKLKEFKQCTFATTQTLTRSLSDFKEDYFDYIIVDEAHHYQAKSFKKVLEHFKPKFTLGLTATPHRMDKKDVFKVIGKKIYEAKVGDAIKKGLLTKINYWSTDNDIDFSDVKWNGKNYNEKDLNRVICVREYDDAILKEYNKILREKFQKKKTICFCATVEHVHRMTKLFNKNGINAIGLTARHRLEEDKISRGKRKEIINGFKDGDYDIIFVRDLFNEGIDIPSCDSIMMLRPTQSHTIFTQQVGRGLRTAEGKEDVLILDFTGNCRNCTINYDVLYEMTNCNINEKVRKASERKAKHEVVILSNGCRIRLSRKKVNILKIRLDSLPMTLDIAIKKYQELFKTKPGRSELYAKNPRIYAHFLKNKLLNKYCLIAKNKTTTFGDAIIKYNKFYKSKPNRTQLQKENPMIWGYFYRNNLLDKYCIPSKTTKEILINSQKIERYHELYKTKPTRSRLSKERKSIYTYFNENNLLDKYCLPSKLGIDGAVTKYNKLYKTKPYRAQLQKENYIIWRYFNENNLLDKYCLESTNLIDLNLQQSIEKYNRLYKDKPGKGQLSMENQNIYAHFLKNKLLNKYCLPNKHLNLQQCIKKYNKLYKTKPKRKELEKENSRIYDHFKRNNLLDKYCLPSRTTEPTTTKLSKNAIYSKPHKKLFDKYCFQPNIKITSTYKPITIIPKTKKKRSGNPAVYKDIVRKEYKSKEDKVDIREKILSNIQDGDKVLLLESPDLSAIKEIEKQNKKPSKIVIPNDKEFKKLAENIKNYKTDLNIEIINTSVLQYLVDSEEKFDFVWLDYCGAFSYYIEDLDVLFKKHFNDMKLVLTYNLFDPAKDDDSYYFTKVIDYVLSKVSETNKIRLINNITYRYKKTMYNIGFEIGDCNGKKS